MIGSIIGSVIGRPQWPHFRQAVGTIMYMAPEVIGRWTAHDAIQADAWALGICLATLVGGAYPLFRATRREPVEDNRRRGGCEPVTKWQPHLVENWRYTGIEVNTMHTMHMHICMHMCM